MFSRLGRISTRSSRSFHTTTGNRAAVSVLPEVKQWLSREHKLFIDGKWVEATSGKKFAVHNPATEEVLTHVAEGGAADVDKAVKAARRAFDDNSPWRRMTDSERGRVLYKFADLLEKHTEEFAQLESLDNGKPYVVAKAADVPLSVDNFRYMSGWATKIHGNTFGIGPCYTPGAKYFACTVKEPVGVVGQIIPWNFPLLMAAWKLGPALASGNTIVLKPAEQTPLTAIRLIELAQEAGIPDGVINLVTGDGVPGAALAAHPLVDKCAFTGSTEVGKLILDAAKGNLKKVSLELGGKSPNIVFGDADLPTAIAGSASAIFFNHGQCCCAGSRLFVEHKVFDEVVSGLAANANSIKVGSGMDDSTQMGPLVSAEQHGKVLGYIQQGKASGAKAVSGGEKQGDKGYFVKPTVLVDTTDDMSVVKEEIFGPVVCAIPFKDHEDLVQRANNSPYGLAAAVWTSDVSKAHNFARSIRAGTVWVNCYNIFDAALPFGGYKESGWGREMGPDVFELYTQTKSIVIRTQ